MRSTYVWLPLSISGTTASMKNAVNWIVDANSGSMTSGPSENTYEGESATLSGGAKAVSCSGCSGSKAAGCKCFLSFVATRLIYSRRWWFWGRCSHFQQRAKFSDYTYLDPGEILER